mmetsp:Transcript_14992/g.47129  ORF Transcript_14992/g.47129 Transcript_14992/m.47129 type:complete len:417 (+) Transcript_14992:1234-2484(+)
MEDDGGEEEGPDVVVVVDGGEGGLEVEVDGALVGLRELVEGVGADDVGDLVVDLLGVAEAVEFLEGGAGLLGVGVAVEEPAGRLEEVWGGEELDGGEEGGHAEEDAPVLGEGEGEEVGGEDAEDHGELGAGAKGAAEDGRGELAEVDGNEDGGEARGEADDEAADDEEEHGRGEGHERAAAEEEDRVKEEGLAAAVGVGEVAAEDGADGSADGEGGDGEGPGEGGVARKDVLGGGVHDARVVAAEELRDAGDEAGHDHGRRHDVAPQLVLRDLALDVERLLLLGPRHQGERQLLLLVAALPAPPSGGARRGPLAAFLLLAREQVVAAVDAATHHRLLHLDVALDRRRLGLPGPAEPELAAPELARGPVLLALGQVEPVRDVPHHVVRPRRQTRHRHERQRRVQVRPPLVVRRPRQI